MAFKDIDELIDSAMVLPINGKKYRIPPVDAATGLWIQKITKIGAKAQAGQDVSEDDLASMQLDDDQEKDFYQRVLGDVYDELIADGVDWERIKLVAQTATTRAMTNVETAEKFWNAGGKAPKGRKPADRKTKKRPAR